MEELSRPGPRGGPCWGQSEDAGVPPLPAHLTPPPRPANPPALSPGRKYDSLIQAQARELSHLRQKMREGRSVCHLLTQRLRDTVKSFEELLRGTDIDYYMGQSFREHLAQGGQLAERLSSKLNVALTYAPPRLSKELREKERMIETLQAKLEERCETPASSRALSESPRSNSSASFLSDGPEACSDGDATTKYSQLQGDRSEQPSQRLAGKAGCFCPTQGGGRGVQEALCPPGLLLAEPWRPTQLSVPPVGAGADLLEGHLVEIRSLRQRLEESICINDRLREQLENRLAVGVGGCQPHTARHEPLCRGCSPPAACSVPAPALDLGSLYVWGRPCSWGPSTAGDPQTQLGLAPLVGAALICPPSGPVGGCGSYSSPLCGCELESRPGA
uniref:Olduvai domain-containing protein n=1 Tax=Chelydra serpentina TaxID=8475 RepID=A0A8C3SIF7_CHESE